MKPQGMEKVTHVFGLDEPKHTDQPSEIIKIPLFTASNNMTVIATLFS